MSPRHHVLSGVALAVVALVAGCGGSSSSGSSGRVEVVATTTQLGDIVRNVAGDQVDVHQILQPNSDPHEYEPRPADVVASAGAKVVFLSGDNLDKWMGKVIDQAGGNPRRVTISPDHVPIALPGEQQGPEASTYDPHWWHDPRNVQAATMTIRNSLIDADPAGRADFKRNASAYLAKVHTLDTGIESCFAKVPAAQRRLVTSHDAFNYFARRYGITVIGAVIPSQTTQAQPSAGEVAKLADLIRREHVKAIYPESSINPKLADALARETGARSDLDLYGDTLGPKGSAGETYLGMEAHNADAMVDGFSSGKARCRIAGL